jgi:hypothetical protein
MYVSGLFWMKFHRKRPPLSLQDIYLFNLRVEFKHHSIITAWLLIVTKRVKFVSTLNHQKWHLTVYMHFLTVLRSVCITNCLWHKCSLCHVKPPETVFMSSSIDWWSRDRLPSANITVPFRTWLSQWKNLLCWCVPDYLQIVSNILDWVSNVNSFPK